MLTLSVLRAIVHHRIRHWLALAVLDRREALLQAVLALCSFLTKSRPFGAALLPMAPYRFWSQTTSQAKDPGHDIARLPP